MKGKMKCVKLSAKWDPKPGFELGAKDIEGKETYLSSQVFRYPQLSVEEIDIPKPGIGEVLLKVKACGICGSDVHLSQPDSQGYVLYPGLAGMPVVLGHEFAGIVADVGPYAYDKNTNKLFQGGEYVCTEEMVWCGECRPCADGYPNHCERLKEIGCTIQGGFAEYVAVPAKLLWSLDPLKEKYSQDEIFIAGSLVEPTCVAYNAVIDRAGGIRPGDNVVICGGGPIGIAACSILKRQGAARVILSEPEESRAAMGKASGADYLINPLKEDFSKKVLEITNGMGADIYLEATGLPEIIYPAIEKTIWQGRVLNSKVVVTARADAKMPVTGEVLQVRRAQIIGSQGHSGYGNFPRVIESMADGMDMTRMVTKQISIDKVPENIIMLRDDKKECKVTCVFN